MIDGLDSDDVESEGLEWVGTGLISLFEEEPSLPYTANQSRTSFFASLATTDKRLAKSIYQEFYLVLFFVLSAQVMNVTNCNSYR